MLSPNKSIKRPRPLKSQVSTQYNFGHQTACKHYLVTMQFSLILLSALVSFSIASPTLQRRQDDSDEFEESDGSCVSSDDCESAFYCSFDDAGENGCKSKISQEAHSVVRTMLTNWSQTAFQSTRDLWLPGMILCRVSLIRTVRLAIFALKGRLDVCWLLTSTSLL